MKPHVTLLTLAVCLLALPALADSGKPVTRPMIGYGNATIVVDPLTGTWQMTDSGEATHLGLWTDTATGEMAFTPLQSGQGTIVAANGDTIDWVMSGNTITYIGGTGRFLGVSGSGTATFTSQQPPVFNNDGTMTVELTYVVVGEIAY